jgi:hypothetical protein
MFEIVDKQQAIFLIHQKLNVIRYQNIFDRTKILLVADCQNLNAILLESNIIEHYQL